MSHDRIVSKSLAGPTEICLRMPMRRGFVEGLATRTYESRLRSFTKLFSDLRTITRESRVTHAYSDIVDRIRTIHGVTIAIEGDDVLLSVHFDKPWEPYIHIVWRDLGYIFDAILCNCEGYVGHHERGLGSEAFAGWIRKWQINTDTFYMNSSHTTDDVLYLDQLEQRVRGLAPFDDQAAARFRHETPEQTAAKEWDDNEIGALTERIKTGVQAVYAFHGMTGLYAKDTHDHGYILNAARSVLETELPKRSAWPDVPSLNTPKTMFAVELDWFENFQVPPAIKPRRTPKVDFKRREVQAGIAEDTGANQGAMALLQVVDAQAAREFLKKLERQISFGPRRRRITTTVGFTAEGLSRLRLPSNLLEKFPRPFLEGMAGRAGLIGDVQQNHPEHWRLPRRNWVNGRLLKQQGDQAESTQRVNVESVDIILQLRQETKRPQPTLGATNPLLKKLREIEALSNGAVMVLHVQEMYSLPGGKEHFGFDDGLSQPIVKEKPRAGDDVPLGDIFLGYERGSNSPIAKHWREPLFKNGTFHVIRKLSQHVARWQRVMQEEAQRLGQDPQDLAEMMMGRRKNGVPMVAERAGSTNRDNNFDYSSDPLGEICPHFSHVRRTNPRTAAGPNRDISREAVEPRIMRRAMSFGPLYDADDRDSTLAERGLLFQAYNADLSDQFELIQRWMAGANETVPYSKQADPVCGIARVGESRVIRLPNGDGVDLGREPFVTLDWGCYAFVPSKEGYRTIYTSGLDQGRDYRAEGVKLIAELQAYEQAHKAAGLEPNEVNDDFPVTPRNRWKRLLEEQDSRDDELHRAIWTAIREKHGGVLRTPFGVLVGKERLIKKVLSDDEFSVKDYDKRLQLGIGNNYLGMDGAKHRRSAQKANEVFRTLTREQGFAVASKVGNGLVEQLGGIPGQVSIPLPKYVDLGLAQIAKYFFGIPDGEIIKEGAEPGYNPRAGVGLEDKAPFTDTVHCPYHFTSTSRAVFQPDPSEYVTGVADRQGKALSDAVAAYVEHAANDLTKLQKAIKAASYGNEFDKVLLGALLGFMPTAQGNFLDTCREWLRSGDFWRVQNAYLALRGQGKTQAEAATLAIEPQLVQTMALRPVPSLIHRRVVCDVKLGREALKDGDHVVVGLVSATAEKGFADNTYVFGGPYYSNYDKDRVVHACPGRELAMGSLLGLLSALFEPPGTLRGAPSPLAVQYNRESLQA